MVTVQLLKELENQKVLLEKLKDKKSGEKKKKGKKDKKEEKDELILEEN